MGGGFGPLLSEGVKHMGIAIRDFIPEGEEATPAEASRFKRGKIIRTGANHDDYIPDPNDPENRPRPQRTKAERQDAAMRAAKERAEWASRHEYAQAQMRLKNWSVSDAIKAMEVMPVHALTMYCAAEMNGAGRVDIVNYFPPIGQEMADEWRIRGEEAAAKQAVLDAEPVQELSVEVVATGPEPEMQPVADSSEPEMSAPADSSEPQPIAGVYLCEDCDKPCASLAGLQAHRRAKHSQAESAE